MLFLPNLVEYVNSAVCFSLLSFVFSFILSLLQGVIQWEHKPATKSSLIFIKVYLTKYKKNIYLHLQCTLQFLKKIQQKLFNNNINDYHMWN